MNHAKEQQQTNDLVHEIGNVVIQPRRLAGQRDQRQRQATGRRSDTCSSRRQGRYITSKRVPRVTDLAFDATLRVAAPYQQQRRANNQDHNPFSGMGKQPTMIILYPSDLRQKVRVRRTRNAVCFVVDASWSMAAEERMCATKAAILSLLRDAYQRRDFVGLVSFQRTYASLLLPLTNSVELAQRRLQTMPVGGKTPLTHGLLMGYEVLEQARRRNAEVIPLLVVLTDGQANVAMTGMPPQQEAYRLADYIAHHNMRAVVIDTEYAGSDVGPSTMISAHASRAHQRFSHIEQGLARSLAAYLQAEYYRLDELSEDGLAHMVRTRLYR